VSRSTDRPQSKQKPNPFSPLLPPTIASISSQTSLQPNNREREKNKNKNKKKKPKVNHSSASPATVKNRNEALIHSQQQRRKQTKPGKLVS